MEDLICLLATVRTLTCALQWFILCVCFSSVNCCTSCVGFRMSFSGSNSCSALSLLSMCFFSTNRPILVVLFSMRLAVQ